MKWTFLAGKFLLKQVSNLMYSRYFCNCYVVVVAVVQVEKGNILSVIRLETSVSFHTSR